MNKFFLYIFLVLATVHGFSVCRAAERVHCEPLTSLLGTKIDCDFTKEFSKGVIFNLKIVRASDGSYNIGFEGLNKDFYKESFICVDKVLNYVRSSHVASSSDSEKVLYFGVVRCTQNALYIDDIAIDTESSSGPQKKIITCLGAIQNTNPHSQLVHRLKKKLYMDDASSDDLGSDDLGSDDLGSDETLYFECEEPSSEDDALFFEDDKISPHFFCLK